MVFEVARVSTDFWHAVKSKAAVRQIKVELSLFIDLFPPQSNYIVNITQKLSINYSQQIHSIKFL